MGNQESLPAGQTADAEIQELATVVASPKFQEDQIAFFEKYAKEFTEEEENKLSWTQIHTEYENQVEAHLEAALGEEKLTKIQLGMPAFMKEGIKSDEVMNAIEVLSSLGDFEEFKQTMITKKKQQDGTAGSGNIKLKQEGVCDIGEVLDNVKQLREASENLEGWNHLINDPKESCWSKMLENGDSCFRCTWKVADVKPELLLQCFVNNSPESCEYMPDCKSKKVVKDWGPHDFVCIYELELAWAIRYITGIPKDLPVHVVTKPNWPEEGCFGYVCVPYDVVNNQNLQNIGSYKAECGIIAPDPDSPEGSIVTSTCTIGLGQSMMPNIAFKKLVQSQIMGKYSTMMKAFKTSTVYDKEKARLGL